MVIRMRDPLATFAAVQRAMSSATRSDWLGARTSSRGAFPLINAFRRGDDFALVAELPSVKKEDLVI